jgi:putative copper export protein/methionine-rich copper-binding protein CopC
MRLRRFLRLLLLSALSLSVLLAYSWLPFLSSSPTASAHAFVIGSDPVDGSTINKVPTVMRIFFNEDISPTSIAHIYFVPNAQLMDGGRSTISSTNPRELDTPLVTPGQLPQGGYIVRWTALSSVDGHTTHGVIGFNIGHSSLGLPGEVILGPSTSNILPQLDLQGVLAVAWDWLVMAALMLWLGILVVEGLILGSEQVRNDLPLPQLRKQSLPLQWLCLAALLLGEIINLVLRAVLFNQVLGNGGVVRIIGQILVETNYGHLWLARIALIGLALGFLWWIIREQHQIVSTNLLRRTRRSARTNSFSELRRQATLEQTSSKQEPAVQQEGSGTASPARILPRWQTITWLTLVGLILLTLALSGDAAQLDQPHFSAIVLDWLYLAAQGVWLGGAAYLAFVLLPHLPISEPDRYSESLVTLLRQYTPLMVGAIGVLLVSGLFLSESAISNFQQFVSDPYGRALLVKIALVAVMLIFTGYALFYLRLRLSRQAVLLPVVDAELPVRRARQSALDQTWRNLKRTMNIVAALGAAVLLCAALMTFFAPPIVFPNVNYTQSPASTAGPPDAQTKTAGNLSVTLQVTPARVAQTNIVTVTLQDSNRRAVTDAQVQLSTNMQIMDMGITQKTIKGGNPAYVAVFASGEGFSMAGLWDITVRIQPPNQQPVQVQFQVMVS